MAKSNNLNHCLFEGFVTHLPGVLPGKGQALVLLHHRQCRPRVGQSRYRSFDN